MANWYQHVENALTSLKTMPGAGRKLKEKIEGIQISLREYNRKSAEIHEKNMMGATSADMVTQISALAEQKKIMMEELSSIALAVRQNLSVNAETIVRDVQRKNRCNMLIFLSIIIAAIIVIHLFIQKRIVHTLFQITEKLYASSEKVARMSAEISSRNRDLAEGASYQAGSAAQASEALDAVSGKSRQNAADTGAAREVIRRTHEHIQQITLHMKKTRRPCPKSGPGRNKSGKSFRPSMTLLFRPGFWL